MRKGKSDSFAVNRNGKTKSVSIVVNRDGKSDSFALKRDGKSVSIV